MAPARELAWTTETLDLDEAVLLSEADRTREEEPGAEVSCRSCVSMEGV